ncbi:MAG: hypothetical protein AB7E47_08310 [Desulfovibrionaceae bacterium]
MTPLHTLFRLAVYALAVAALCGCAGRGAGAVLFSPEDAQALRLDQQEWDAAGMTAKALNLSPGPGIRVVVPDVVETESGPIVAVPPVATILVEFLENTAPVDMATLDIVARKGWFSRSLTAKLAPYVEGTRLQARNLRIPTGQYKLEMRIKDIAGHATEQTFRFEVND